MDGILLINKEKGVTSREVVNQIQKKLKLKKVGHAGTLDPLATGLLVIGVGKGTKIMSLLTLDEKEYLATVKMGMKTDTLDVTGNIISENYDFSFERSHLETVLNSFKKKYYQEVPIYSAIKIKGKKLYEYARKDVAVQLPKRLVEIKKIKLLDYDEAKKEFSFLVTVSKGTYIRSLIRDIGESLKIDCTMKDLVRLRSGKFQLEDSYKINDDFKLISLKDALDVKSVVIKDENLLKKVSNGNKINFAFRDDYVLFLGANEEPLALYKKTSFDEFQAFKVF